MVEKIPAKPVYFLGNTMTNLKSTMDVLNRITLRDLGAPLRYQLAAFTSVGVESGVSATWPIGNAQMVRLEVCKITYYIELCLKSIYFDCRLMGETEIYSRQ